MRRLYYLTRSIDSVDNISADLHEHGVTDWRFHIVSKDEAGLYTHRLHRASVLDRTDLVRFVERGLMIGAVFALVLILGLQLFSGFEWPLIAWIFLAAFFTLAGGWLGGFGGITGENYRIRRFHNNIEKGEYLVMVDVPRKHMEKMKQLMAENHPEARLQGETSSMNNPFVEKDGKFHVT